jgi:hypothetical protein
MLYSLSYGRPQALSLQPPCRPCTGSAPLEMRHIGCEGFDPQGALGQRRQVREVFRGDVFAKDEHGCPLIADDGHDVGLAGLVLTFFAGLSVEQNLKSSRAATGRKVDNLMQVLRSF